MRSVLSWDLQRFVRVAKAFDGADDEADHEAPWKEPWLRRNHLQRRGVDDAPRLLADLSPLMRRQY